QILQAGFSLYLQTGSVLLGVKLLPDDEAAARDEHRAALELARNLLEPLAAPGADPRLALAVQVHAEIAQVREGEVIGGPLVDVGSWVRPIDVHPHDAGAATEPSQG